MVFTKKTTAPLKSDGEETGEPPKKRRPGRPKKTEQEKLQTKLLAQKKKYEADEEYKEPTPDTTSSDGEQRRRKPARKSAQNFKKFMDRTFHSSKAEDRGSDSEESEEDAAERDDEEEEELEEKPKKKPGRKPGTKLVKSPAASKGEDASKQVIVDGRPMKLVPVKRRGRPKKFQKEEEEEATVDLLKDSPMPLTKKTQGAVKKQDPDDMPISGEILSPGLVLYSESVLNFAQTERLLVYTAGVASSLVCTTVPYCFTRRSGTFVIDLNKLDSPAADIALDGFGQWTDGLCRSRYYVEKDGKITRADNGNKKPEEFDFQLFRKRYVHPASDRKFVKTVTRLYDRNNSLYKYAVVCYEWACTPFNLSLKQKKKNQLLEESSPQAARQQAAGNKASGSKSILTRGSENPEQAKIVKTRKPRGPNKPKSSETPSVPIGEMAVQILCEYHMRRILREEMEKREFKDEDIHEVLVDIFGLVRQENVVQEGLMHAKTEDEFLARISEIRNRWRSLDEAAEAKGGKSALFDFLLSVEAQNFIHVAGRTPHPLILDLEPDDDPEEPETVEEGEKKELQKSLLPLAWNESGLLTEVSKALLQDCWSRANRLLAENAVSSDSDGAVTVKDGGATRYQVTVEEESGLWVCDDACPDYTAKMQRLICAHTLAAAEAAGKTFDFLEAAREKMAERKMRKLRKDTEKNPDRPKILPMPKEMEEEQPEKKEAPPVLQLEKPEVALEELIIDYPEVQNFPVALHTEIC